MDQLARLPKSSPTHRRLGITPDQYYTMLETRGHACDICGSQTTLPGKRLCVDHCHETNSVRGVICHKCNTALAMVRDNVVTLAKMIVYLQEGKS